MEYSELGNTGISVSKIALGGHEYFTDGRSKGFHDNHDLAITPDFIFEGFGGQNRIEIIKSAYECGINLFDVTIDTEKEALGRNLKQNPPPYEIFIQTRPEGMVYTYDENNVKMTQLETLRNEVFRILKLIKRDTIDFFNIAPMKEAFDHDPDYLEKIGYNLKVLKKEGHIRFACADTFSGEETYVKLINSGHFDVVYINFNLGDYQSNKKVLPLAVEKNLGITTREVYMKGELFNMAREAGISNFSLVARAALKWNLSHKHINTIVYGVRNVSHLQNGVEAFNNLILTDEENAVLEKIKQTKYFKDFEIKKTDEFLDTKP